jgi:hypothetical protein
MRVEEKDLGLTGRCRKCHAPLRITRDKAYPIIEDIKVSVQALRNKDLLSVKEAVAFIREICRKGEGSQDVTEYDLVVALEERQIPEFGEKMKEKLLKTSKNAPPDEELTRYHRYLPFTGTRIDGAWYIYTQSILQEEDRITEWNYGP